MRQEGEEEFFTENASGMIQLENNHYVTSDVMIDSGKYQQFMLKSFGKNFLSNKILIQS